MPHGDLDYQTAVRSETIPGGTDLDRLESVDLGPAQDEVWDVLNVHVDCRISFEGTRTNAARAQAIGSLHTNANEIVGPAVDAIDAAFDQETNPRTIGAAILRAVSQVEDETNGTGSAPHVGVWQDVFTFEPGDLQIGSPGSLSLGMKVDNDSGATVEYDLAMSVHYLSQARGTLV